MQIPPFPSLPCQNVSRLVPVAITKLLSALLWHSGSTWGSCISVSVINRLKTCSITMHHIGLVYRDQATVNGYKSTVLYCGTLATLSSGLTFLLCYYLTCPLSPSSTPSLPAYLGIFPFSIMIISGHVWKQPQPELNSQGS